VLVIACLKIIAPFLGALLWGTIIAISTWPVFDHLQRRLRGRQALAAFILTTVLILVFVVPISLLVYSLTEHVASVVGPRIETLWQDASTDMPALLETARPAIRDRATWLLKQSGSMTLALLEFLLSIVLAGFLCVNGAAAKGLIERLISRIAGPQGFALISIAGQTVRSVSIGGVGTALMRLY
jgi:predicted PurR-regulated permease PerM